MIVVDIEGTGTEPHVHSIVSIGAVDLLHPERQFYDECRIWDGAHVMEEALLINGFTEQELRDSRKKTEAEIVQAFIAFALDGEEHTLAGHNPSYDRDFLKYGAMRAHLDWPFPHRTYDSHSMCYLHMVKRGIKPPVENKRSALNLDAVLKYVGLPSEPKPHNALNGARFAAESFSRLLYDKPLFEEYRQFQIPWISDSKI